MKLSDAIANEGYGFFISENPGREDGVVGDPPMRGVMAAALVRERLRSGIVENKIACIADSWDLAYAASHEIAEHRHDFKHSAEMFCTQSNILARWHRLRGG